MGAKKSLGMLLDGIKILRHKQAKRSYAGAL